MAAEGFGTLLDFMVVEIRRSELNANDYNCF